jgi:NOL1/NOP2/fmu family ribosome biogenesis protein
MLVANEVIKSRAFILAENIAKWGITNTIVTQNDPRDFSGLAGYFDIILVDAPCSGEGMFRDPVAVNEWSEANTHHCAERQKRILSDIWPALKKNGILIYSTCTFNPEENEHNVKWLLTRYLAETVEINTSDFKGIVDIDFQGIKGYGFYPGTTEGEGFFISVLRKTGSADKVLPGIRKNREMEPNSADLKIVKGWTGFKSDNIIKKGDQIISFPGMKYEYYLLQQQLKIIYSGTRIGSLKKNGFIPDHELALSGGIIKDAFSSSELDYHRAVSYLRRENFLLTGIPVGWFIATYSGINLGFFNNIGKRINNYYPVDWRIRKYPDEKAGADLIQWK